jgi:hypothetical protein
VRHAVDNFVDGAIAAEDQNEAGATFDGFAGQARGIARRLRRQQLGMPASAGKDASDTL